MPDRPPAVPGAARPAASVPAAVASLAAATLRTQAAAERMRRLADRPSEPAVALMAAAAEALAAHVTETTRQLEQAAELVRQAARDPDTAKAVLPDLSEATDRVEAVTRQILHTAGRAGLLADAAAGASLAEVAGRTGPPGQLGFPIGDTL